jgi:tRNA nucleotidyltransferase/poly(A) polymerase
MYEENIMTVYKEGISIIPEVEMSIWNALIDAGYDTYLVGGAVRDILLGKYPDDYDFATQATPEEIEKVFSSITDKNYKLDFVGESFGVMIVNGVEVATFRGDRYFGGGDKDVEITYVNTIEEDLSRRDFTINAMALDIQGNLIDPFWGEDDLLSHNSPMITFVGNPEDRINEDPNRMLRAFRFASRLNGTIGTYDFDCIVESVERGKFDLVSPERIRMEIIKTLDRAEKASTFWEYLRISGILNIILPELADCFEHDHGNHHTEDVWTHNMLTGDYITFGNPLLRLAAFLHDVGKPAAYDPVKRTFYEHHIKSAEIVRRRLTDMKFSNNEIRYVVNLVLIHMDGTRGMSGKARRRLKNKLERYGLHWAEYLAIRVADRHANLSRPDFTDEQVQDYIDMFTIEEEVPFSVHDLALSGGDIIRIFGLEPGPIVGEIQRSMLEFVLDHGENFNKVNELVFNVGEMGFGLRANLDELAVDGE